MRKIKGAHVERDEAPMIDFILLLCSHYTFILDSSLKPPYVLSNASKSFFFISVYISGLSLKRFAFLSPQLHSFSAQT